MALIKLIGFTGEIPRLSARLLPETAAQVALDTRLDRGNLTPIRKSRFTHTLPAAPVDGYKTLYRHNDEWLAWAGLVHAAPGPVAQDRLYFTGDGEPKMRIDGTEYPLAVPRPTAPLTAALSGTASEENLSETRIYVYTFVTAFGEESEPCAVSNDVLWNPGQTVTLSGFQAPPAGRNITRQRIYRSQSSTSGTLFYFIAERSASSANYSDTVAPAAIGEVLPSLTWNAPRSDLAGLISLPNGMMAAFAGRDLYFCEPWHPHAWPESYSLTMDYPIVGLGAYGTTIVVATTGNPYVVSGTAPENMIAEKMELNLPCINARGIVDLGYAVAYPSNDGLVLASSGGARVATEAVMTREDWLKLRPDTMIAGQHDGRYVTTYNYADRKGEAYQGTIVLDMTGATSFVTRSAMFPSAFYYDITRSALFYAKGREVYEWDAIGESRAVQSWRSKPFILPKPANMGVILIEADQYLTDDERAALEDEAAAIEARNEALFTQASIGGELGGAVLNGYPIAGDALEQPPSFEKDLTVHVYADDVLVASVPTINRMARLPSGFLAQKWEIEVTGTMIVTQIMLANVGAELAGA